MSKIQKIWMWVSFGMFLVPEILWSPIINFYYEFFQSSKTSNVQPFRFNFLQNSDNINYLKLVIFIQFIGLLLLIVTLIKNKRNIKNINYILIMIPLVIALLLISFTLYFAMNFSINIM